MFSDDTVFYFEALRDNYHREELIGFAWGNQGQIYASADISLLTTELFKKVLEQPIATYDFKRSKVLLSHLGLDLPAASYDARLANYLLSTVEDNEMATLARLYTTIPLDTDEVVYGKESSVLCLKRLFC